MSFARAFRPAVVAVVVLAAAALTACGGGSDGARGSRPVDRKASGVLGAQLCVTNVNLAKTVILLKPEFEIDVAGLYETTIKNNYRDEDQPFPPGTTQCVQNEIWHVGSGQIRVTVGGDQDRQGLAFWIAAKDFGFGDPEVRVRDSDVHQEEPCETYNGVTAPGVSLAAMCHHATYGFAVNEKGWVDPYVDWDQYPGTTCTEWFKVGVTRLPDDDNFVRFSAEVRQARIC